MSIHRVVVGVLFIACAGQVGPPGPVGPPEPTGTQGPWRTPGADAPTGTDQTDPGARGVMVWVDAAGHVVSNGLSYFDSHGLYWNVDASTGQLIANDEDDYGYYWTHDDCTGSRIPVIGQPIPRMPTIIGGEVYTLPDADLPYTVCAMSNQLNSQARCNSFPSPTLCGRYSLDAMVHIPGGVPSPTLGVPPFHPESAAP